MLNAHAFIIPRDLFDLSKDNIQIKESKTQGILLSGATEVIYFLQKLLFPLGLTYVLE